MLYKYLENMLILLKKINLCERFINHRNSQLL